MQFRMTYAGRLLAHQDGERLPERSLHVHTIRKEFHKQLGRLWRTHPVLKNQEFAKSGIIGDLPITDFVRDGFRWLPLVTESNGLVCGLDILVLRDGKPGNAIHDVDNRLKTIFDALRMAKGPDELGRGTSKGIQMPQRDEEPFYVILEDDKLITHVSVTTDNLLDPLPDVPEKEAVRLVLNVTIRPYHVLQSNLAFS